MPDFSRFISFWTDRGNLSAADWKSFYHLTHSFLAACPVRSFEAELGDRKALIDDFFHDKIFMSAGGGGPAPYAPGALCQYFRNYLVDRTRNAWDAHKVSVEDDSTVYEGCGCDCSDDVDQVLADAGLEVSAVAEAARSFLKALEEPDRLYLALNTCADEAEALSNLAEKFRIASYHYRAKRLGITREKGQCETGYEKTRIGGWLQDVLGIGVSPDRREEILAALKILCLVSLSEWETVTP